MPPMREGKLGTSRTNERGWEPALPPHKEGRRSGVGRAREGRGSRVSALLGRGAYEQLPAAKKWIGLVRVRVLRCRTSIYVWSRCEI